MKSLQFGVALAITLTLLLSCASAPTAEQYQASSLKEKIEKYNLEEYASGAVSSGNSSYEKAESFMSQGEWKDAKENYDIAISNYMKALDSGIEKRVKYVKSEVDSSRKEAGELKASVAVKEDYDEAQSVYDAALKAQEAGDEDKAIELFTEARLKFEAAAKKAKEKKEKAAQAMSELESALSELDEDEATEDSGE